MKLQGHTILVTGGASGIGLALVRRFRSRGANVIVCGRDDAKLAALTQSDAAIAVHRADVARADEREAFARNVIAKFPDVSVLVNNAGIQNQQAPWVDGQSWADAEREIAINLAAPIHLTSLFLPHLRTRPAAAIINVTSGLAFVPMARMPVYCATKAALHSFTESLRVQCRASSVKVIELAPPAVNTDLGGKGLHDFGEPVDAYADDAVARLEQGEEEIGYKMSEGARLADRATRAQIFSRLNP
ncbi:MAG: SDR family NAD(P)-dependent oxidoreductase [Hyphomicrobiales bacterium]|nr:SDR family NAD(P)-dependent oxidoreductase [Hyphomicrobiales bacterium]